METTSSIQPQVFAVILSLPDKLQNTSQSRQPMSGKTVKMQDHRWKGENKI